MTTRSGNIMKKEIILKIAGFLIKLSFNSSDWKYARKQLIHFIEANYKKFIIAKNNIKGLNFDYELSFQNNNYKVNYIRRNSHYYIDFFIKKDKRLIIVYYHISYIQMQLILLEIVRQLLAEYNGFIIHCSANKINKGVNVFVGKSGSGKSTIMKNISTIYPALSDDFAYIRFIDNTYCFYQREWPESKASWIKKNLHRFYINKVFILRKSKKFAAEMITDKNEIYKHLLDNVFTDNKYLRKTAINLFRFIKKNNFFYYLNFTKDKNEALCFFKKLK